MATKKLTPKQLEALRKGREKRAKQLKSVAKSATTRKKTAKNATVKRKSLSGVGSYKVIAGMNINSKKYADYYNSDDYDQQEFWDSQVKAETKELQRRGYSYTGTYVIETSSGEVVLNSIEDCIEGMAVKEGVNLVEFADGKIGYVSYYGSHNDWFKIIRKPTNNDVIRWENGEIINLSATRKKTAKNATVKRKSLNGYERKTCLALSKLSANDINTIIRHYFNTDIFSHFYFQQLARKSNDAARQWAINTIADEVSYEELHKDGFI